MDKRHLDRLEAIKKAVEARVIEALNSLRSMFASYGFPSGPVVDMSADDYEWTFNLHTIKTIKHVDKWYPSDISVSFKIMEQAEYEGDGEDGINFGMDVIGPSGIVIGTWFPGNYTPEVWVNMFNQTDVDARFNVTLHTNPIEMVETVQGWVHQSRQNRCVQKQA